MDPKQHWERVYGTKKSTEVSWYQAEPILSLSLVSEVAGVGPVSIIDVGGGSSALVDRLVDRPFTEVTVLDLSGAALREDQERLGERASRVKWVEADILTVELPEGAYDVWHDRAVFHFLTDVADRRRYVAQVLRSVRRGGHVLVATFGEDGPERCSGLNVARYSPEELHAQFGAPFRLLRSASRGRRATWACGNSARGEGHRATFRLKRLWLCTSNRSDNPLGWLFVGAHRFLA